MYPASCKEQNMTQRAMNNKKMKVEPKQQQNLNQQASQREADMAPQEQTQPKGPKHPAKCLSDALIVKEANT
jgi:hypothetical protein